MRTWGHGDMGTWGHGDMRTWGHEIEDMMTWGHAYLNMRTWGHDDNIRTSGNVTSRYCTEFEKSI